MTHPVRILILGAAYGLLPGIKLALAGHHVTLVGRAAEVAAMRQAELTLHLPLRRQGDDCILRVPVGAAPAPGVAALAAPASIDVADHDFVFLAMQEPHYAAADVADLMARIAAARLPCLSIMNLPPLPFLQGIEAIPAAAFDGVYASRAVWQGFAADRFSVACPDAQAIRPDPEQPGRLRVTLASNFKAAPFACAAAQALLERLAHDMSRLKVGDLRPPVHLLAKSSRHVPLVKWPMLIAGNCRCFTADGVRTIADAVTSDLAATRALYQQILALVQALGTPDSELVSFETYAAAATGLTRPSSFARALAGGAVNVERIDRLVHNLLILNGQPSPAVAAIVERVDAQLARNRAAG